MISGALYHLVATYPVMQYLRVCLIELLHCVCARARVRALSIQLTYAVHTSLLAALKVGTLKGG